MLKYPAILLLAMSLWQPATAQDSSYIFYLNSLHHELAIAKEDTNKVWLLADLSGNYSTSKPDSAILFGQQALLLASRLRYVPGAASAKQCLGTANYTLGNYLQADQYFLEAYRYTESEHLVLHMIGLCASISTNKRDAGNYRDALTYCFKGDSLDKDSAGHCMRCFFPAITGSVYVEMNMPDSALYYLEKANAWGGGYRLWLQGRAYEQKGNDKLAYTYYHQGIAEQLKGHWPKDLANVYSSLAHLLQKKGSIDSCIFYAGKAYNAYQSVSYTKGIWESGLLLSSAYEHKDAAEALRYYKLAMAAKDKLFDVQKTTQFLNAQFAAQQQKQQEETDKTSYQNKVRTYVLAGVLLFFLLLAGVLYRNNRHKQKAKAEIEKAYRNLKATQAQLVQSEKMASLGELTAGIAHEIQNPLNFVNNFSEVSTEMIDEMTEELDGPDIAEAKAIAADIRQNLQKINEHGRRADSIVKGMLQHSRQTKGVNEPTNINKLCDEYLRLSYHGLRAKDKAFNADFTTDFDESIGAVNIVPQDIGRVLLNLCNNAFYAVYEKKKRADEFYKPLVSVSTKRKNDGVEIIIADNGSGIPQSIIDKIFQPFFTTKPTGQGTGLGLSLAYDIITKEHRGILTAESKEGEGSRFVINIPGN